MLRRYLIVEISILFLLQVAWSFGAEQKENHSKLVIEEMEMLRETSPTGPLINKVIAKGTNVVPQVIQYLDDNNYNIRRYAAYILGEIGDCRAVDPLINHLSDKNSSTGRILQALEKLSEEHVLALDDNQVSILADAARDGSPVAVRILAQTRGESASDFIHEIIERVRNQMDEGSLHEIRGRRVLKVCYEELMTYDDEDAKTAVRGLLKSQSIDDRMDGIEIVANVGKDMTSTLVPLLSDKRDAQDISPSGAGNYYLRICDLAADVLRELYDVELESKKRYRYSDRDLDLLRQSINGVEISKKATCEPENDVVQHGDDIETNNEVAK